MSIDLDAAKRFMFANARLLDRHRLAVLLEDSSAAPVLQALGAYRNQDGGFGNALEPDVRGPHSEPASTLSALEILAEIDSLDHEMCRDAGAWIETIAEPDGGVPFVFPAAARYPRAPWMVAADGGSILTFALAARLWEARSKSSWLPRATEWCWRKLESGDELSGYWVKFGLEFLDHVPEPDRALAAIDGLRPRLRTDGSLPVEGGTENEQLTALALSPRPGLRSRALVSADQIEADLDVLERGQQGDGGWTFDWLAWSPAQAVEWRGIVTLRALATLAAHRRVRRQSCLT